MSKRQFNDDIWYNVVRFLSPEDLRQANSCHHVLFEEWMRYRYTSVKFLDRDGSIRLLEHLCDTDSTAAAYIRKVEIRPWLVQPLAHSIDSSVKFPNLLQSSRSSKAAKERIQKQVNEDVFWVNAAFRKMPNVVEYSIDWDGSFRYHRELYQACLTAGLDGWSDNLIKLTVKVPPAMLNSFVGIELPKLQSFNWHLYTGSLSPKEINMATDGFMVFLNNLKDSLRSLCIVSTHSSHDLDLSRIFRKMGRFPLLSKIALTLPADGQHLSEPATFVRFLEKHRSSLEEISLRSGSAPSCNQLANSGKVLDREDRNRSLNLLSMQSSLPHLRVFSRFMDRQCSKLKEMSFLSARAVLVNKAGGGQITDWILQLAEDINIPFPQLRSLSVSMFLSGACSDPRVRLVHLHCPTLDSLSLVDFALSHDDILSILRPSPIRAETLLQISTLSLRIHRFSSQLLIDLALLLPELKTARIECNTVVSVLLRILQGTSTKCYVDSLVGY
ncbi:hypothetical protein JR316_0011818 [Psilocybe cubensis]|uniref:F-box domain-containing protein n=2 Tax=Psilocybe cubensis TaxID=181762 RepID=A0A8H8CFB0_PSICU|nr:hypothetical protein JR316_0011818 [Psilocybe cubensis]KAH9476247.1 hypothetical protein JR316_0011818 [Psilocybe cubensis]